MTNPTPINEYMDLRFGFPVCLIGFPMREVRGEWVPALNGQLFRNLVLAALAKKLGPLTGQEVRFIRLSQNKTLAAFGAEMGVKHQAVMKWEAYEEKPTRMSLATERQIRYSALESLPEAFLQKLVKQEGEEPLSISRILKTVQRMLTRSKREPEMIALTPEGLERLEPQFGLP